MTSGSSIITNLTSNLRNTYSYLASLYPEDGVTYKNITAAKSDNSNYLTLNQPFASYLQTNFSSFDKSRYPVFLCTKEDEPIFTTILFLSFNESL